MAPPRKHDTDRILDAARTIALRDGPRATSVAALAHESGAPAGTLYHRFGSRDRLLQAAWLRALERFRSEVLAAAGDPDAHPAGPTDPGDPAAPTDARDATCPSDPGDPAEAGVAGEPADPADPADPANVGDPVDPSDPVEAGVAMAAAAVRFARRWPDDARLLAVVRRGDLLDGGPDPDFHDRLAAMNAPLAAALGRVAAGLGRTTGREREAVVAAVVDLPEAAVRRHAREGGRVPSWLEGSIAAAARRLLTMPVDPAVEG